MMSLFYKRVEDDQKVVITYASWSYIATPLLVLVMIAEVMMRQQYPMLENYGKFVFLMFIFVALGRSAAMYKVSRELRERQKDHRVEVTGSRYSLSDPMILRMYKP